MILVDIYIPALERSYDFSLQEQAPISALIEELIEMIGQKEHWPVSRPSSEFLLADPAQSCVFAPNDTLAGRGVLSGTRLILL